jgi:hypothetical protein
LELQHLLAQSVTDVHDVELMSSWNIPTAVQSKALHEYCRVATWQHLFGQSPRRLL